MVKTTRIVVRCDRCDSEENVAHYTVHKTNAGKRRQFSFDACSGCAANAPLEEWERLSGKGAGRRLVRRVVDPAVVEAAATKPRKRVRKG